MFIHRIPNNVDTQKKKLILKKSMTVSDNNIQAEGLGKFLKNLGNTSVEV